MHILSPFPSQDGYEPFPVDSNQELGMLDIYHPSEGSCIEETKISPQQIILRCELKPLPLTFPSPEAQLILEGEALHKCALYAKPSIAYGYSREWEYSMWAAISLHYLGKGQGTYQNDTFDFEGTTLPMGSLILRTPLFTKTFITQHQNLSERHTTLASGQLLTSPPDVFNTRIFKGYGGYYKPGIPLEEIQQIYFSFGCTQSETKIKLYDSSFLERNLTPPPQGGKEITFYPPLQDESIMSLSGALIGGYAIIEFQTESISIRLRSYTYKAISGSTTDIDIFFKP